MNISCGRGNPLSGAHVVNHYILLATSCAVVGTRHLSVLDLFLRASCLVLSWLGSPWFPVRIDWLMTFNSLDPCHLYILSCLSVKLKKKLTCFISVDWTLSWIFISLDWTFSWISLFIVYSNCYWFRSPYFAIIESMTKVSTIY